MTQRHHRLKTRRALEAAFPRGRRDPRRRTTTDGTTAEPDLDVVDLGDAGCAYVRSQLATDKALTNRLLSSVDFDSGRATTTVPAGTPRERLERWNQSILHPTSSLGLRPMAREIGALEPTSELVLVAEDYNRRPSSPSVLAEPTGRFIHGDEVYEYCTDLSDEDRVIATLHRADWDWVLNAVVSRARPPRDHEDGWYLDDLAANVQLVLVRAYDGEGFVVWQPNGGGG